MSGFPFVVKTHNTKPGRSKLLKERKTSRRSVCLGGRVTDRDTATHHPWRPTYDTPSVKPLHPKSLSPWGIHLRLTCSGLWPFHSRHLHTFHDPWSPGTEIRNLPWNVHLNVHRHLFRRDGNENEFESTQISFIHFRNHLHSI